MALMSRRLQQTCDVRTLVSSAKEVQDEFDELPQIGTHAEV